MNEENEDVYNLVIMKLITGEELICVAKYEQENNIFEVQNPMALIVGMTEVGSYGINMIPYLKGSDDEIIIIHNDDVITTANPSQEITDIYLKMEDSERLDKRKVN